MEVMNLLFVVILIVGRDACLRAVFGTGCVTTGSPLHIKCGLMAIKQNEDQFSDIELVRRIGTGNDRDAEAELFRRMAPRVRLYGLRHLRDEHAADDLTQQVLMTTITALRAARLREPDKLVSFMLGTCRMTVLDIRRGAQRNKRL